MSDDDPDNSDATKNPEPVRCKDPDGAVGEKYLNTTMDNTWDIVMTCTALGNWIEFEKKLKKP